MTANRIGEYISPRPRRGSQDLSRDKLSPTSSQRRQAIVRIEHFIAEHAAICLGAAFITGVYLGWLIKRS